MSLLDGLTQDQLLILDEILAERGLRAGHAWKPATEKRPDRQQERPKAEPAEAGRPRSCEHPESYRHLRPSGYTYCRICYAQAKARRKAKVRAEP